MTENTNESMKFKNAYEKITKTQPDKNSNLYKYQEYQRKIFLHSKTAEVQAEISQMI